MSIDEFAIKNHLSCRRDEYGNRFVAGTTGQIYECSENGLAVLFMSPDHRPRLWSSIRAKCLATGMQLLQDADGEGSLSFDPTSRTQARLAIKVVGATKKRKLTVDQKHALVARLGRHRHQDQQNLPEERHFSV